MPGGPWFSVCIKALRADPNLFVQRALTGQWASPFVPSAGRLHWGTSQCQLLRVCSLELVDFSRKKSHLLLGS